MTAAHGTAHPTSGQSASLQQKLIDVAHLLRRAGFGATPDETLAAAKRGRQATALSLIAYDQIQDAAPAPPASVNDPKSRNPDDLAAWWLARMITTPRPLQEKLTLFWHGHFATAISKVGSRASCSRRTKLCAPTRWHDSTTCFRQSTRTRQC